VIRLAQILLLIAAGALWVASRLPWVSVTSFDGLTHPQTATLNGADWSTALLPMAVLLGAAALAALAARGWLLRLVAVLLGLVCLALGYLGVTLVTIPDVAPRGAELAGVPVATLVDSERYLPGAVVTLAAAVVVLVAAVLLMRAAVSQAHRADRSSKYTAPGAVGGAGPDPLSERGIWDALDEGRDPTGDTEGR
jgi:uncharacterized membrane protein (TIGR02234 family)